jgi:hypothetical protein
MDATRVASDFAFHPISDVSCIDASVEVPFADSLFRQPDDDCFLYEDDGCDTAPLMLSLTERDGPRISAKATLLEPAPFMPPI